MKKSLLISILCLLATAMQAQYSFHIYGKGGSHTMYLLNSIDSLKFVDMQEGAAGEGTVENPYNVAAALKVGSTLEGSQQIGPVYVKGVVIGRSAIFPQTGQRTYTLGDNSTLNNAMKVYKGYSFAGAGFVSNEEIDYGDTIVVYGKIGLYEGTAEIVEGSEIYSINGQTKDDIILPKGDGTLASPYNVAAALAMCKEVGEVGTTTDVYATGYITELTEVSTTYGNATFKIADKKEGGDVLTVYRAKSFKGENVTDENLLHVGDSVVICGKLVNFKGNTPEFTQGCYIVSINGIAPEEGNDPTTEPTQEPETIGTLDAPKSVAEALTAISQLSDNATTEKFWYIKGKVKTVKTTDEGITRYKNIDYTIVDEGATDELTVFRGKYFEGGDFTVDNKVQEGDEVIIYGKLQKYVKNDTVTPEVAKDNYLVFIKKTN
ncbi:MAG: hypothetical protein IJ081_05080 [Prevotella sp.]|nr:hypothetical protein [Prevotella sp.]